MRSRWLVALAAIAAIAAGAVLVYRAGADARPSASGSPTGAGPTAADSTALPARAVTAGAVQISIEPIQIDGEAAVFRIVMDTHSEELTADLAGDSAFEVDGIAWVGAAWSGDPPGGHHRQGELTFEASGEALGSATLTLSGFSFPVEATWTLGP